MVDASDSATTVFDRLPDGRKIRRFGLVNGNGLRVGLIELGAIITSIRVPDRGGTTADIVLGHDDATGYLENVAYFGAVIGRYANRIADGRFRLDGVDYALACNNGRHHLHGGKIGFDKRLWHGEAIEDGNSTGVRFRLQSDDGEEGYPGRLDVTATYSLDDSNRLSLIFHATTSKTTVVNLTQHSYFNLSGHEHGTVHDQELQISADAYTPVNESLIPSGRRTSVAGTAFDFRKGKAIGTDIDSDDVQLRYAGGYDHNFVLSNSAGNDGLRDAALLYDPVSGRRMSVRTTEPGIQLYTANALDVGTVGKNGVIYGPRCAVCLETQHFPNSPNVPTFPSTVLRAGETFFSQTVFAFDLRD